MIKRGIENIIFGTKWLLLPFYIVLALALLIYTYFDVKEFIEYLHHFKTLTKDAAMLTFVELIDMTMVANLGKMIITGSYNSFISKEHNNSGENISSGMLKVKMASSMVGITSIGLLQKGIQVSGVSWDILHKLAFVHVIFLASVIILAIVDYLHEKAETNHKH
jgi:uncharacterized protein (TIGR00645 family)